MSNRIPTEHDMDIVNALDLMRQHYMDQTNTEDQAAADFERDEAITIKRAMNEITRLRAQLERAREGLMEIKRHVEMQKRPKVFWVIAHDCLRELDQTGGDSE